MKYDNVKLKITKNGNVKITMSPVQADQILALLDNTVLSNTDLVPLQVILHESGFTGEDYTMSPSADVAYYADINSLMLENFHLNLVKKDTYA